MPQPYFSILTEAGDARIASAIAAKETLRLTHMAVGDGNGGVPAPARDQIGLVNEVYRAALTELAPDPNNPGQFIAAMAMPENVGGWWVRELGLYDDSGTLCAVANCAPAYKPRLAEGTARFIMVRFVFAVQSAEIIELKIDPNLVMASRHYVDQVASGLASLTMLASEDPQDGDARMLVLQQYDGAVSRSQHEKNDDVLTDRDFFLVRSDTERTRDLQAALATQRSVYLTRGRKRITDTLFFTMEGQMLYGDGKSGQSILANDANEKPLFATSAGDGSTYLRRTSIRDLSFEGNPTSIAGVLYRGIDDGLTGDTDKSSSMTNVRISGIGSGYALRVASWCNNFYGVELWGNRQGLWLGNGANACNFYGLYSSNNDAEALTIVGMPGVIGFYGGAFQYSGGANYMMDIQGGISVNFIGVYLENSRAPLAVVGVSGAAKGINFTGVFHNLVHGTPDVPIIVSSIKGLSVKGLQHIGGSMAAFVRLTGYLPLAEVGGLVVAGGTIAKPFDDQSERKSGILLDAAGSRMGPISLRGLTTQNLLEARQSDTDTARLVITGGGAVSFGADNTAPTLTRAGDTVTVAAAGSVYCTWSADQFRHTQTGVLELSGPGSPEGVRNGPPGSKYWRTDGGAGKTLYVKETGTGNTGWIAK